MRRLAATPLLLIASLAWATPQGGGLLKAPTSPDAQYQSQAPLTAGGGGGDNGGRGAVNGSVNTPDRGWPGLRFLRLLPALPKIQLQMPKGLANPGAAFRRVLESLERTVGGWVGGSGSAPGTELVGADVAGQGSAAGQAQLPAYPTFGSRFDLGGNPRLRYPGTKTAFPETDSVFGWRQRTVKLTGDQAQLVERIREVAADLVPRVDRAEAGKYRQRALAARVSPDEFLAADVLNGTIHAFERRLDALHMAGIVLDLRPEDILCTRVGRGSSAQLQLKVLISDRVRRLLPGEKPDRDHRAFSEWRKTLQAGAFERLARGNAI